jgi:diguanylate cyclase (GGDEF)-like protein/PAS domain S-box-containing protein
MADRKNIAPIITWLAAIFITLVVIIVPTGHFFVSYQYIKGSLATEAEIGADAVNQVINLNPEMWDFEQERLAEYLTRRPALDQPETRRIYKEGDCLVAERVDELIPPLVTASHDLFDSGAVVGRIEIARSLSPLLHETGVLIILMLPLGAGAFLTLRLLPIRSLYRTERSLLNTNQFLKGVMESTTNAIAVVNPEGRIVHANKRASSITGYRTEELVGQPYSILISPRHLPLITREAGAVVAEGADVHNLDTVLVKKDGELRNISCGMSPLAQDGRVAGIVISAEDITDRRKAERDLLEAKERYERVVEDLPDFICRYRPDLTITFVNLAYAQHLGRPPEALGGMSFLSLLPTGAREHFGTAISSLTPSSPVATREFHLYSSEGEQRWHHWRDRAFFDDEGRLTEIQSIGQDITERKQTEERLHTLSLTDELTGLYNRRGFYTLVEQQLKMARRHKTGILLLSADLDDLKVINDTWGHQEGDAALVDAANIIRTSFRESDVVARIGGDEFVVFQLSSPETTPEVLTARLHRKLAKHNEARNGGHHLSLSIGIIQFGPDSRLAIDEMLDQADRLMYETKRQRQSS